VWKYVNVRRQFVFFKRSIYYGTQRVVYEPKDDFEGGLALSDRGALGRTSSGTITLATDKSMEILRMRVQVTVNKTNTGRIQLACVRSTNERGGIGTGFALPPFNPNALAEVEEILRNLGIHEALITQKTALLRQVGANDLIKVDDLDVADEVLRENGFVV
jgi:hypothetical protein